MIGHFRFVLFDIRERAIESLLFARKQNETDRAPRALPGTHDGFRGTEGGRDSRAVVCCSLGQIPRIEMPADDKTCSGCSRPRISPITLAVWTGPLVNVFCTLNRTCGVMPRSRKRSNSP